MRNKDPQSYDNNQYANDYKTGENEDLRSTAIQCFMPPAALATRCRTVNHCQLVQPTDTADWYCHPDPPAGGYGIDPAPLSQSQTAD